MSFIFNEYDVANIVERLRDRDDLPNTRTAACTLARLVEWTNRNSDGWPYWAKPSRAAAKLQETLQDWEIAYRRGDSRDDLTAAEVRKLFTPIKSFLTRQGANHDEVFSPRSSDFDKPKPAPEPEPVVTPFRTNYFDEALTPEGLEKIVELAAAELAGKDFDTLVGTGFSGAVVIPILAARLGKHFVLIRKDNDDSHHGSGRCVGNLGERWLFVDDFVSSGATFRRVERKLAEQDTWGTRPACVGAWLYSNALYRSGGGFRANSELPR